MAQLYCLIQSHIQIFSQLARSKFLVTFSKSEAILLNIVDIMSTAVSRYKYNPIKDDINQMLKVR